MKDIKVYAFADEASPSIDGQIKAMLKNDVDGLEIRNVDGTNISWITNEKAKEVRGKLDAFGLRTWSIGSPIGKQNIDDPFEPHLDVFKHTLELAHILGAENIRLFSFFTPSENRDSYKDKVIEYLARFVEAAKGSGITLCHENEKGIYGDEPERCLEIHKALPELKAIFDPANYVQCRVNTWNAWNMLKPYVKYLHIKDADEETYVVPAGKGLGNVGIILDEYRKLGGDSVTIEPHLAVFDGLEALERDGERSAVGPGYKYPSSEAAFAAAVRALRNLL